MKKVVTAIFALMCVSLPAFAQSGFNLDALCRARGSQISLSRLENFEAQGLIPVYPDQPVYGLMSYSDHARYGYIPAGSMVLCDPQPSITTVSGTDGQLYKQEEYTTEVYGFCGNLFTGGKVDKLYPLPVPLPHAPPAQIIECPPPPQAVYAPPAPLIMLQAQRLYSDIRASGIITYAASSNSAYIPFGNLGGGNTTINVQGGRASSSAIGGSANSSSNSNQSQGQSQGQGQGQGIGGTSCPTPSQPVNGTQTNNPTQPAPGSGSQTDINPPAPINLN